MIQDLFSLQVLLGVLTSGIRLATPYLYAAIGETLGQRSGVLNLGVDGMMLVGAFGGYYVVLRSGNLWLGLLVGALAGLLMGLAMAVISVTLQAEQGISGIGVYLFGLGLSDLLYQRWVGTPTAIDGFRNAPLPLLSQIPFIGPVFFDHSVLVYGAYLLVPAAWFVLHKTTFGLQIRAVGENPESADSLGVSVTRVRYITVTLGGLLSGIAGASLSLALLDIFQQNLTNGLGFIAVALVYFGGWRPTYVLLGALLFSLVNALQVWVQVLGIEIPSDVAVMMPYVLTIVVLVLTAGRVRAPAALTKPYERGG
jgi:simple sugar transport system permease protein